MIAVVASLLAASAVLARPPSRRSALRRLTRHASLGSSAVAPLSGATAQPGPIGGRPRAAAENRRNQAQSSALSPALVMELAAAALDAGLPAPSAVAAAVRVAGARATRELHEAVQLWQLGATLTRAWRDVDASWQPLARCLVLSERTGASAATMLRAGARDLRSTRRRGARVAAHRLGVGLVVPLGLTSLPAFLLWAVVPVVLGLAQGVLTGS